MENKSRTTYSIINLFSNFVGYGLNLLLSFICRMVFARCLAQEYLGISGLFTNILSMLSLTDLGIGTAIGYALYKPLAENDEEKISSLMNFYGKAYKAIGFVIAVLGLCLLPFLNLIIGQQPGISDSLYVLYLLYLFNSVSSYFFSYRATILITAQRSYIVTAINYCAVIIQNIVQMIALIVWKNFTVYLVIQIICGLAANIVTSQKAKKDYPCIRRKNVRPVSKEEKKSLIVNIKALTLYKLSGLLVNNTDNIVITYFKGLVTTGVASNYTMLTGMISSMLNLVFSSMTASIGNFNAMESEESKYKIFRALNLVNYWLFGWGTVGIIVVSGDLIRVLFGADYVLPESVPIILAINFYISGMQTVVLNFKSTMGLFRYGQYVLLFTAAINIIGDIALGQRFGLVGIFAATAVARLFTNAWYEPYAVYKFGFHREPLQYLRLYLKYAVVVVFAATCSYFVCTRIVASLIMKVILDVIICSVITNLIFWICFGKEEEYAYLNNKIFSIFSEMFRKVKK